MEFEWWCSHRLLSHDEQKQKCIWIAKFRFVIISWFAKLYVFQSVIQDVFKHTYIYIDGRRAGVSVGRNTEYTHQQNVEIHATPFVLFLSIACLLWIPKFENRHELRHNLLLFWSNIQIFRQFWILVIIVFLQPLDLTRPKNQRDSMRIDSPYSYSWYRCKHTGERK